MQALLSASSLPSSHSSFLVPYLFPFSSCPPLYVFPNRNWSGVEHGSVREREGSKLICLLPIKQGREKNKVDYKKMKKSTRPTIRLKEQRPCFVLGNEKGGWKWWRRKNQSIAVRRRIYYVLFVCWSVCFVGIIKKEYWVMYLWSLYGKWARGQTPLSSRLMIWIERSENLRFKNREWNLGIHRRGERERDDEREDRQEGGTRTMNETNRLRDLDSKIDFVSGCGWPGIFCILYFVCGWDETGGRGIRVVTDRHRHRRLLLLNLRHQSHLLIAD